MVEHAKQNENTWCYMASWKHCVLGHGHGMKALGATWTWLNMQNKMTTLMEALCAGDQAMHLFRPAAVAMVAYKSPNLVSLPYW